MGEVYKATGTRLRRTVSNVGRQRGCETARGLAMELVSVERPDDPRVADFRDVPDPERVRRRGLFVAEGRLVVRRLLATGRFTLRALLVTRTALDALSDALVAAPKFVGPVYVTSSATLREIGGYDFHQGCLGLAVRPTLRTWMDLLGGERLLGPLVVLEKVGNPDNIGGTFRHAAALGASAVLLSPGCSDPLYRKAVRTSTGATLYLPFAVADDDWPEAIQQLRERGRHVVGLTPHERAIPLDEYRAPAEAAGVALLLGNEGDGLSPGTLAMADVCVRIPVDAPVDSLNVATAAAIALYHLRCAHP